MSFEGRDLISLKEYSNEEIMEILNVAEAMVHIAKREKTSDIHKNHILATVFFEPSTRTRLSFTSAMYRLGGKVVDMGVISQSSIAKGESLADTLRTIEQYSDLLVLRHPMMGAARFAADLISNPVINAGDGSGYHPTQTLLDLYTIWTNKKSLSELNIALMGDLKYGRTTHSLSTTLGRFTKNLYLCSPKSLKMPKPQEE